MRPTPAILVALLVPLVSVDAREQRVESHHALAQRLEDQGWVPPYFQGRVEVFEPAGLEPLLEVMRKEPYKLVQAGPYAYRTSPARIELGRRLFESYDWGTSGFWREGQRFTWYALGLSSAEELRDRFGLPIDSSGRLTGLVGRTAPDGRVDYGWTCALCHAGPDADGRPIPGAPNHRLEYGRIHHLALAAHPARPDTIAPGLLDRDTPVAELHGLGPGRLDMNGDRIRNPVKIPALWGLQSIRTGMFVNGSVGNLWMGIPHNGGPFPDSDLNEAIVAYVLSLSPPPNPALRGEPEARGERIFEREKCAACHSGPHHTNGDVIPLEIIGTDPSRARAEFPKGYRVPTLSRLDLSRRFLHDGSIESLHDLFLRQRLMLAPGHEYGLDLTQAERDDLVAFLLSL